MSKSGGVAAKMTSAATSVVITNHSGLHARPAVKLTKLAKRFDASVRMRIGEKGDWIDAKSVVKVMGMRAAAGEILYFADSAERRTTTITARSEVTMIEIKAETLRAATYACQVGFNKAFMRVLIERLMQANRRLAERA